MPVRALGFFGTSVLIGLFKEASNINGFQISEHQISLYLLHHAHPNSS